MNDIIELHQVIKAILRRWWLLALLIPLGAMSGYAVSQAQTPIYQATTTILVGPLFQATEVDRQDLLTSQMIALTYTDLVNREPILQKVVVDLNLNESWRQLKKQIKVEQVKDTQLIQITVENRSPQTAQLIADDIVRQLIAFPGSQNNDTNSEEVQFAQSQLETLQGRIASGNSKLVELENEIIAANSPEELASLQNEKDALQSLITSWESNYTQLLVFLGNKKAPNNVSIIESAQATPSPVRPSVQLFILVGGMVGLFLALVLIFLFEYLNDALENAEEFSQQFGLPVIGLIGKIHWYKRQKNDVYVSHKPSSPVAEAYRSLRANLEFAGANQHLKTILVTSCDTGVGKTSVATNLAAILAQGDKKVILVDADLRKPRIHEIMGLSNELGFSDILQNRVDPTDALQAWGDGKVLVVTSGPQPPNPSELLSSRKVETVLNRFKQRADLVIIDSPPSVVSDAMILAAKVDGVLMVVQPGRTHKRFIQPFLEHLERAGARMVGVVMNRVPQKGKGYYGNYLSNSRRYSISSWISGRGKGDEVHKPADQEDKAIGLRF